MKVLVTSDWHHDWSTYGVVRAGDVEEAVGETLTAAVKQAVDLYLFLGDLADPEDGPAVLKAAALAMNAACILSSEGIPSVWIPGNHCVVEDGSGATVLRPMLMMNPVSKGAAIYVSEVPRLHRVEGLTKVEGLSNVIALPFTASSHAYDPAEFVRKSARELDARLPTIVMGHLCMPGVQPGEETTEMPRGREVTFPYDAVQAIPGRKLVFNGHYHRQQTFTAPNGLQVHIPGSLARLTMCEEHHSPGYLIAEV